MKSFALSLGLALALGFGIAAAQGPPAQDQAKTMEAYAKAMAVTEHHRALEFFIGRWDVTSTMWAFPGTPPQTSRNAAEFTSILGGRFVMMTVKGTMMGQPFEAVQVVGYDNMQQKYTTFWIDNNSTAMFFLAGTYDAAAKAWVDKGTWSDPMGGMTPVRAVVRITGPDEYVYEWFITLPDGKEFKSLENRCVRKK